jgi:murein DD-endopeptidase MepM/ murein hydrolase activator NlpD
MLRKPKRRTLALLLAVALATLCAVSPASAAQTKEEIEKQIKAIDARIDAQEVIIATLEKEKTNQEKLLPALETQVNTVQEKAAIIQKEIDRLNSSVAQLNRQIEALTAEIEAIETQIDDIIEKTAAKDAQIKEMQRILMERLRRQYIAGPVSNLQLLLQSPDLSGLLTVSEYISRQAEQDQALRVRLEKDMADLKVLQDQLEERQGTLETKKYELQKQSAALVTELMEQKKQMKLINAEHAKISKAQTEIFTIIDGLKKKTKEAERIIAKSQKEQEEFERRLDQLLAEKIKSGQISQNQSNNGRMQWPFPYKGCYISSPFGDFGPNRTHAHRGLDISIADKSKVYYIQAALDGTILDHGFDSSMGNYVVIYHGYYAPTGKTIKTTYMHMRDYPSVVDNTSVQAGKIIGIMGNTGNSRGAHLHFQVNEYTSSSSSVAVNPLNYISNPYN